MNVLLLYLLLLKATVTSFSGLTSVPVVRQDFVVRYRVLTDRELNAALAAGRSGPGPYGLYVVSVGYFVAGIPGALAGFLAMITPAFLIIPMARYLGVRAEQPRIKRAIQAVMLAAAGLVAFSAIPMVRDAVSGPMPLALAAASFVLLTATEVEVAWVILGSGLIGLATAALS